jgi:hypothetical protein
LLEEGELILGRGAKITHNFAENGGGVAIGEKGFMKMMSYDKNSYASIIHNQAEYNGGGVFVYQEGRFELIDGIISENQSGELNGGGVCLGDVANCGGSFFMKGGIITTNRAETGGGIAVGHEGYFEMSGGKIISNSARDSGGLSIEGGSCKLMNGIITGNRAEWSGGGVYIRYHADDLQVPLLEMTGGAISGNVAGDSGGGVEIFISVNTESIHFNFSSGVISGNIAGEGRGGGIYMHGGNCLMTGNAVLCGNMAREYGGGVYIGRGLILTIDGNFILDGNAVISANIAGTECMRQTDKKPAYFFDIDEATGNVINMHTFEKQERESPAWGGGICLADACCEMRGGIIKANLANKGGGIFVASPEEIKEMDGGYARPGVSGVFKQTGGEILANTPDDIFQKKPDD